MKMQADQMSVGGETNGKEPGCADPGGCCTIDRLRDGLEGAGRVAELGFNPARLEESCTAIRRITVVLGYPSVCSGWFQKSGRAAHARYGAP